MTRATHLGPTDAIWDVETEYGSIEIGNTPATSFLTVPPASLALSGVAPEVTTDFDPASITTTIFTWYDFADTATITLSGSNAIAMADKGDGFDLQSGASAGPLSGTRTRNGLNVGDFQNPTPGSGTGSQWLETVNVAGFFPTANATYTMFAVFAHDLPAATNYSAVAVFGTSAEHGLRVETDGSRLAYVTAGGGAAAGGAAVGNGVWRQSTIEVGSIGGQPLRYRESGLAVASTTLTGSPTAGTRFSLGVRSGGGRDFDGAIAEVLFYSPMLGSTDRGLVEAYLAGKWAV